MKEIIAIPLFGWECPNPECETALVVAAAQFKSDDDGTGRFINKCSECGTEALIKAPEVVV